MKRLLVIILCILSITLTGCIKEVPLNEEQTDIIAEYMASRLLEYDKKYTPSLISYHELYKTDDSNEDDTQPVSGDNPDIGEDDRDNKPIIEDSSSSDMSTGKEYTLTEVIKEPGFEVQYTGYQFTDTYPKDETNLVFSVDPREGYQLLVVDFTIKNTTDKDKTIDLSKASIQYQLDINVGTIYKPLFALLENNLQYIKLNIKAGEKIPAVLIFEVNKNIDMSDINLIVSRDSRTEIIEIK